MQTTGKNSGGGVVVEESLTDPLSKEFLKLIAKMAAQNELIELALKELHPGVKNMLQGQDTEFILGFVNCAQYFHDMITGLLVDPITKKYEPSEELDQRDAQSIRFASMIDATAFYCVILLAERGYIDLEEESN